MLVRDVMTKEVKTITSETSLAEARRILREHRFKRLPVVDNGQLVGVVTEHRLERITPSGDSPLTVWEVSHLLEKTQVKKIMQKSVVTVSPDSSVEEAVGIAQKNKVGALIVLENKQVLGVITTNDFFYKVANPVLGIGEPGPRFMVEGAGEAPDLARVLEAVAGLRLRLVTLHVQPPSKRKRKKNIVIHVDGDKPEALEKKLTELGYEVSGRSR